jgi:predicted kinase
MLSDRKKILIMGLPGAGKTTLAEALLPRLNAVYFNADMVRANVHKDLGFALEDRIEHARRLGWLSDQVVRAGPYVIADFICPTAATRDAFGGAFTVWVDRIKKGRFDDTNALFQSPETYDIRVSKDGAPEFWAEKIAAAVRPMFDPKAPTALFVGRYQPFHAGHRALIEDGIRRIGQVCLAVRDTAGGDKGTPCLFEFVRARIEEALREHNGRFVVVPVTHVPAVYDGRDIGRVVERVELDHPDTEELNGSKRRHPLDDEAWHQTNLDGNSAGYT